MTITINRKYVLIALAVVLGLLIASQLIPWVASWSYFQPAVCEPSAFAISHGYTC